MRISLFYFQSVPGEKGPLVLVNVVPDIPGGRVSFYQVVRCHGRILSHFTQGNLMCCSYTPPPFLTFIFFVSVQSIYIRLILFIQIGQPGGSGDTGPKGYEVRKRQDDCENKILGLSLECF